MKSSLLKLFAIILALTLVAGTVSAQPIPTKSEPLGQENVQNLDRIPVRSISGPAVYIVRLDDAPLASYRGGTAGLAATSPSATGQDRLQVNSPASLAYRDYLAEKQDQLIATMEKQFGHEIEVLFRYDVAYNGLALRLTGQEAQEMASLPGVAGVQRDFVRYPVTDVGPAWIGAPSIWDGSATGGLPGSKGEGMIVGVIDTGINFDHPSFAAEGGDSYNHTNPFGTGNYKGWCNPSHPQYDPLVHLCNDKLVGAWDYTNDGNKGEDDDGHGSHTASTAAGNVTQATITAPTTTINRDISGVAPHANIIAYDACLVDAGCPGTALVAAINQAVTDGVDVINYSIGGGPSDPWADADSQAFLAARDAGVFVATSAGNDGPAAATMGSPANAPWLLSVGGSTHDRKFANALINMSGGGTTPPPDLYGQSITSAYGPAPIVHAKNFGDGQCLTPFPTDTWTNGEIVVCDRGEIARVDKGSNVLQGGAGGFVLSNTAVESEGLSADAHYLPAVHIGYAAAQLLEAWLDSGTNHMATIAGTTLDVDPANGDIMADFSSRGPNPPIPDVIKPDVTAPGVAIIAASMNGIEFESMGGTSMASPHAAGAAALVKDVHSDWSDAEVQSALMMAAYAGSLLKEDGATPADPFDYGAGRIDLTKAAQVGLVLDETKANFDAADPGLGGDPKTLNLPSMAEDDCQGTCSWTRTVRSTLGASAQWTASVVGAPPGLAVTVTPDVFTVAAGGSRSFDVEADVSGFNAALHGSDGWGFAWLVLQSAGQQTLHMPIAVKKNYASAPSLLTKQPSVLQASSGDIVEYTIEIQNHDSSTNTYSLVDTLPPGLEYVDGSATGGLVYNGATRQLTWSGDIGPGAIDYVATDVAPLPYVNLGSDVAPPETNLCDLFGGSCDEAVVTVPIAGDTYTFYGEVLDEVKILSNGMLMGPEAYTNLSFCGYCNAFLPEPTEPQQSMAGLWSDYNPSGGAGAWYISLLTGLLDNPDDLVLYANWHNVPYWGVPTLTSRFGIAVVMDGQSEPAGRIYYIYDNVPSGLSTRGYTVGVEDKAGERGTTHAFRQCSDSSCISHTPVGDLPANGTTLRLDPVVSGDNYLKTLTYQARITAAGPAVLTNVIEVTSDSPDPQAQAMWATADVSVSASDLYITKDATPHSQDPGGVVTYTIVFGNQGDTNLTGVVVSDTLPLEVEYASSDPPGTYDLGSHELVWEGLDLDAGQRITATVAVTVGAGVTPGIWITNTVYLFGGAEPIEARAYLFSSALDSIVYLPLIQKDF